MESRVLFTQQLHPWRPCRYSFRSLFQNPLPRRSYAPKYRRWDSNAETIRSKRFGFSFGGKGRKEEDYDAEEDEEEEEDYGGYGSRGRKKRRWWSDEQPEMGEGSGGILEDAIDSLWILKVFKSYGWALPAIIISLLLSTGPKAFLMALALPLLQSAFSLAFDKFSGRTESRPKRRPRRRRKPFPSSVGSVKMDDGKYNEEQDTSEKKTDYQSWVVGNDASATGQDAASFGGWDDLERIKFARKQSRRKPTGKGKLSQRERTSDTPLLLRLLIAVFPFLGYWTKMFW